MKPLYVAFTMDVERILNESPGGGPLSWEIAKNSAQSYAKILNSHGFYATFFIIPHVLDVQADVFRELQENGNECGMHYHIISWADNFKKPNLVKGLGNLSYFDQKKALLEARDYFTNKLKITPKSYRSGFFSQSDETYQILQDLGFNCGSTSLPGRIQKDWNANWYRKRRDVHQVDGKNRLISGNLDFVDVPVSNRLSILGTVASLGDIRLENIVDRDKVKKAIEQCLRWQLKHKSPLNHLCFFTHNLYDFSENNLSGRDNKRQVLLDVFAILSEIAKKYDFEIVGSTISGIRSQFLN